MDISDDFLATLAFMFGWGVGSGMLTLWIFGNVVAWVGFLIWVILFGVPAYYVNLFGMREY